MSVKIISSVSFKLLFQVTLVVILLLGVFVVSHLNLAVSNPIEQPVISYALIDCKKAYLIQIFESGKVQYRGAYGVETIGKRETQISKQALNELLKKIERLGGFSGVDDRINLPARLGMATGEAIRLRQGNKTMTFIKLDPFLANPNSLVTILQPEIFSITNASQWLDFSHPTMCWDDDIPAENSLEVNKLRLISR